MNTNLISYYHHRAKEYESIYRKPERQDDLKKATIILQQLFSIKNVIEIACGTGYWTERIAATAASVFATDINDTVIEIAKQKSYPNKNVHFGIADLYDHTAAKKYEALFGGFIWSHIPVQELNRFIARTTSCVEHGGTIVFMDNKFVGESNLPITNSDEQGNTFQTRLLKDDSVHLVLKNFPSKDFVMEQIKDFVQTIEFIELEYYWVLNCTM